MPEFARIDQLAPALFSQMQAQARRLKRRLRLRKPPKPASIKTLQRSYLSDLRPLIDEISASIAENVTPHLESFAAQAAQERPKKDRLDDFTDDIARAMAAARLRFVRRYTDSEIVALAEKVANRINSFNARDFDRIFGAVMNVKPTRLEPWLAAEMKGFVRENVSLISSIPQRYYQTVEQNILRSVRSGRLTGEIKEELREFIKVEDSKLESRAALIARDQTAKFNGNLNQLRQTNVGVDKYTWSTSLDERVRPSHAEKEGRVYYWNDPPADTGHPGEDFQCRCAAIPVFDFSGEEG